MQQCPFCQTDTIEIRSKLVCPGCHSILETCCDGGKCHTTRESYTDKWKQLAAASAQRYQAYHERTASWQNPPSDLS